MHLLWCKYSSKEHEAYKSIIKLYKKDNDTCNERYDYTH